MKPKEKFYECGGCGMYHRLGFNGDCRDDANRYDPDRLPANHEIVEEDHIDRETMEYLKEKAEKIAAQLGLSDIKMEIDPEMVSMDGIYSGALVLDGWVCIYPEPIESETLIGKVVHAGYALDVAIPVHNYPHEPDDVDVNRIDVSTNAFTILGKAFELLFKHRLDNILEGMGFEEAAEEDNRIMEDF